MGEHMTRTMHRPASEVDEAPMEAVAGGPPPRRRGRLAAVATAAVVLAAAAGLAVIRSGDDGTDVSQGGTAPGSAGEPADATEPAPTPPSEPAPAPAPAASTAATASCPTAAPSPPGPRVDAAVAGDPSGLLVLGGADGSGNRPNDTWAFACGAWARPARAGSPAPPFGTESAAAYDAARGHTLLVASDQSTWTWKDGAWAQHPTATKPTRLSDGAMAYDATRQRVLLFGSAMKGGALELWSWDGASWSKASVNGAAPPDRSGAAFAYDAARGKAVLFGGMLGFGKEFGDTWTYDGSRWTEAKPKHSPPAGPGYAAFDPVRGNVVLLVRGETWTWDGADWAKRETASSPGARGGTQLTWDPTTQKVVLFGGKTFDAAAGDLWAWDGRDWAKASSS